MCTFHIFGNSRASKKYAHISIIINADVVIINAYSLYNVVWEMKYGLQSLAVANRKNRKPRQVKWVQSGASFANYQPAAIVDSHVHAHRETYYMMCDKSTSSSSGRGIFCACFPCEVGSGLFSQRHSGRRRRSSHEFVYSKRSNWLAIKYVSFEHSQFAAVGVWNWHVFLLICCTHMS